MAQKGGREKLRLTSRPPSWSSWALYPPLSWTSSPGHCRQMEPTSNKRGTTRLAARGASVEHSGGEPVQLATQGFFSVPKRAGPVCTLLLICKGVNSTTLKLNNVITCEGDRCYGPERRAGKASLTIATAVVVIVGAVSARCRGHRPRATAVKWSQRATSAGTTRLAARGASVEHSGGEPVQLATQGFFSVPKRAGPVCTLLLICKGVNSTTLKLDNVITCEGDRCYGPERRTGKAHLTLRPPSWSSLALCPPLSWTSSPSHCRQLEPTSNERGDYSPCGERSFR